MPQASSGNTIFRTEQIVDDIVTSADIKDATIAAIDVATDAIEAAEIAAEAVGTAEIDDGAIVNADISASAGIEDTKLAQITTAGKVSAAALTSLANTPAGAGVMPSTNVPPSTPAIVQATVSGTIIVSADTVRLTGQTAVMILLKSVRVIGSGTYRITYSFRRTGTDSNQANVNIYKNGLAFGIEQFTTLNTLVAYTQDLTFVAGDLVQLYGTNNNKMPSITDCEVSLFRVRGVETAYTATAVVTD